MFSPLHFCLQIVHPLVNQKPHSTIFLVNGYKQKFKGRKYDVRLCKMTFSSLSRRVARVKLYYKIK